MIPLSQIHCGSLGKCLPEVSEPVARVRPGKALIPLFQGWCFHLLSVPKPFGSAF